eukprot:TRINITY_DN139_c3_g1_i1.p1 TRINITY_DN139_c3_g1~~TRINITY_DN139_c3_g1_i1.p1  ORF type:complete len:3579 (+),score=1114.15 TRINITY_DN139_c3_g1_i1:1488-10739(+)
MAIDDNNNMNNGHNNGLEDGLEELNENSSEFESFEDSMESALSDTETSDCSSESPVLKKQRNSFKHMDHQFAKDMSEAESGSLLDYDPTSGTYDDDLESATDGPTDMEESNTSFNNDNNNNNNINMTDLTIHTGKSDQMVPLNENLNDSEQTVLVSPDKKLTNRVARHFTFSTVADAAIHDNDYNEDDMSLPSENEHNGNGDNWPLGYDEDDGLLGEDDADIDIDDEEQYDFPSWLMKIGVSCREYDDPLSRHPQLVTVSELQSWLVTAGFTPTLGHAHSLVEHYIHSRFVFLIPPPSIISARTTKGGTPDYLAHALDLIQNKRQQVMTLIPDLSTSFGEQSLLWHPSSQSRQLKDLGAPLTSVPLPLSVLVIREDENGSTKEDNEEETIDPLQSWNPNNTTDSAICLHLSPFKVSMVPAALDVYNQLMADALPPPTLDASLSNYIGKLCDHLNAPISTSPSITQVHIVVSNVEAQLVCGGSAPQGLKSNVFERVQTMLSCKEVVFDMMSSPLDVSTKLATQYSIRRFDQRPSPWWWNLFVPQQYDVTPLMEEFGSFRDKVTRETTGRHRSIPSAASPAKSIDIDVSISGIAVKMFSLPLHGDSKSTDPREMAVNIHGLGLMVPLAALENVLSNGPEGMNLFNENSKTEEKCLMVTNCDLLKYKMSSKDQITPKQEMEVLVSPISIEALDEVIFGLSVTCDAFTLPLLRVHKNFMARQLTVDAHKDALLLVMVEAALQGKVNPFANRMACSAQICSGWDHGLANLLSLIKRYDEGIDLQSTSYAEIVATLGSVQGSKKIAMNSDLPLPKLNELLEAASMSAVSIGTTELVVLDILKCTNVFSQAFHGSLFMKHPSRRHTKELTSISITTLRMDKITCSLRSLGPGNSLLEAALVAIGPVDVSSNTETKSTSKFFKEMCLCVENNSETTMNASITTINGKVQPAFCRFICSLESLLAIMEQQKIAKAKEDHEKAEVNPCDANSNQVSPNKAQRCALRRSRIIESDSATIATAFESHQESFRAPNNQEVGSGNGSEDDSDSDVTVIIEGEMEDGSPVIDTNDYSRALSSVRMERVSGPSGSQSEFDEFLHPTSSYTPHPRRGLVQSPNGKTKPFHNAFKQPLSPSSHATQRGLAAILSHKQRDHSKLSLKITVSVELEITGDLSPDDTQMINRIERFNGLNIPRSIRIGWDTVFNHKNTSINETKPFQWFAPLKMHFETFIGSGGENDMIETMPQQNGDGVESKWDNIETSCGDPCVCWRCQSSLKPIQDLDNDSVELLNNLGVSSASLIDADVKNFSITLYSSDECENNEMSFFKDSQGKNTMECFVVDHIMGRYFLSPSIPGAISARNVNLSFPIGSFRIPALEQFLEAEWMHKYSVWKQQIPAVRPVETDCNKNPNENSIPSDLIQVKQQQIFAEISNLQISTTATANINAIYKATGIRGMFSIDGYLKNTASFALKGQQLSFIGDHSYIWSIPDIAGGTNISPHIPSKARKTDSWDSDFMFDNASFHSGYSKRKSMKESVMSSKMSGVTALSSGFDSKTLRSGRSSKTSKSAPKKILPPKQKATSWIRVAPLDAKLTPARLASLLVVLKASQSDFARIATLLSTLFERQRLFRVIRRMKSQTPNSNEKSTTRSDRNSQSSGHDFGSGIGNLGSNPVSSSLINSKLPQSSSSRSSSMSSEFNSSALPPLNAKRVNPERNGQIEEVEVVVAPMLHIVNVSLEGTRVEVISETEVDGAHSGRIVFDSVFKISARTSISCPETLRLELRSDCMSITIDEREPDQNHNPSWSQLSSITLQPSLLVTLGKVCESTLSIENVNANLHIQSLPVVQDMMQSFQESVEANSFERTPLVQSADIGRIVASEIPDNLLEGLSLSKRMVFKIKLTNLRAVIIAGTTDTIISMNSAMATITMRNLEEDTSVALSDFIHKMYTNNHMRGNVFKGAVSSNGSLKWRHRIKRIWRQSKKLRDSQFISEIQLSTEGVCLGFAPPVTRDTVTHIPEDRITIQNSRVQVTIASAALCQTHNLVAENVEVFCIAIAKLGNVNAKLQPAIVTEIQHILAHVNEVMEMCQDQSATSAHSLASGVTPAATSIARSNSEHYFGYSICVHIEGGLLEAYPIKSGKYASKESRALITIPLPEIRQEIRQHLPSQLTAWDTVSTQQTQSQHGEMSIPASVPGAIEFLRPNDMANGVMKMNQVCDPMMMARDLQSGMHNAARGGTILHQISLSPAISGSAIKPARWDTMDHDCLVLCDISFKNQVFVSTPDVLSLGRQLLDQLAQSNAESGESTSMNTSGIELAAWDLQTNDNQGFLCDVVQETHGTLPRTISRRKTPMSANKTTTPSQTHQNSLTSGLGSPWSFNCLLRINPLSIRVEDSCAFNINTSSPMIMYLSQTPGSSTSRIVGAHLVVPSFIGTIQAPRLATAAATTKRSSPNQPSNLDNQEVIAEVIIRNMEILARQTSALRRDGSASTILDITLPHMKVSSTMRVIREIHLVLALIDQRIAEDSKLYRSQFNRKNSSNSQSKKKRNNSNDDDDDDIVLSSTPSIMCRLSLNDIQFSQDLVSCTRASIILPEVHVNFIDLGFRRGVSRDDRIIAACSINGFTATTMGRLDGVLECATIYVHTQKVFNASSSLSSGSLFDSTDGFGGVLMEVSRVKLDVKNQWCQQPLIKGDCDILRMMLLQQEPTVKDHTSCIADIAIRRCQGALSRQTFPVIMEMNQEFQKFLKDSRAHTESVIGRRQRGRGKRRSSLNGSKNGNSGGLFGLFKSPSKNRKHKQKAASTSNSRRSSARNNQQSTRHRRSVSHAIETSSPAPDIAPIPVPLSSTRNAKKRSSRSSAIVVSKSVGGPISLKLRVDSFLIHVYDQTPQDPETMLIQLAGVKMRSLMDKTLSLNSHTLFLSLAKLDICRVTRGQHKNAVVSASGVVVDTSYRGPTTDGAILFLFVPKFDEGIHVSTDLRDLNFLGSFFKSAPSDPVSGIPPKLASSSTKHTTPAPISPTEQYSYLPDSALAAKRNERAFGNFSLASIDWVLKRFGWSMETTVPMHAHQLVVLPLGDAMNKYNKVLTSVASSFGNPAKKSDDDRSV